MANVTQTEENWKHPVDKAGSTPRPSLAVAAGGDPGVWRRLSGARGEEEGAQRYGGAVF